MKKLKLKLDGKEMLTKNQMKKISGGYSCDERSGCAYSIWKCEDYLCQGAVAYVCSPMTQKPVDQNFGTCVLYNGN